MPYEIVDGRPAWATAAAIGAGALLVLGLLAVLVFAVKPDEAPPTTDERARDEASGLPLGSVTSVLESEHELCGALSAGTPIELLQVFELESDDPVRGRLERVAPAVDEFRSLLGSLPPTGRYELRSCGLAIRVVSQDGRALGVFAKFTPESTLRKVRALGVPLHGVAYPQMQDVVSAFSDAGVMCDEAFATSTVAELRERWPAWSASFLDYPVTRMEDRRPNVFERNAFVLDQLPDDRDYVVTNCGAAFLLSSAGEVWFVGLPMTPPLVTPPTQPRADLVDLGARIGL